MTLVVNTTDTITSNEIDTTGGDAIQYGAANIQITIAPGIFVGSTIADGVSSNLSGSTLINNGNIYSGSLGVNHAVLFEGNSSTIVNNASHNIIGAGNGIFLAGNGATVTNHGNVSGLLSFGIRYFTSSSNVVLNNDGEIYGGARGIFADSLSDGGTINNSGLIHSESIGISVSTATFRTTVIDNLAGGTIKGANCAIDTDAGRIILDNRGTVAGIIDCNAATGNVNDVVINKGKITGNVFLGPGDDTFNGNGGTATAVFGEIGNDTLIGGKGNDALNGGAGIDLIRGGRGKDQLFGGTERDLFDFNSIKDSLKGAKRDTINDFQHGNNVTGDDIDLKSIDAKTGVGGNQAFKFIGKSDFHDKKGELRYEDKGAKVVVQGDVNGDGKADFEILVKVGTLSAGDFLL